MTSANAVEAYYRSQGLAERIFTALRQDGHSIDRLTPEILAPYDEFHVGGMEATYRVADRLQISADTRLIDIGCGAGGPARAVAARYGCRVTGIDLTDDFIKTGGRFPKPAAFRAACSCIMAVPSTCRSMTAPSTGQ